MQDQKEVFLAKARAHRGDNYLPSLRTRPVSRYVIKAGWGVSAVGRTKTEGATSGRSCENVDMSQSSILPRAQVLAEVEEVLRTIPPIATRRHPTPENSDWLGRAVNAIENWSPDRKQTVEVAVQRFHSRIAVDSAEGFRQIESLLNQAKHDLRAQLANANSPAPGDAPGAVEPAEQKTVFVIHGRQYLAEFHAFLRAIGLTPVEWSQARAQAGVPNPFTWEVVEGAFKEAGAIVALLTPDDEARLQLHLCRPDESSLERELLGQPRQNVLFEAGVAFGRNQQRTVLVRIGAHRPMSDLAGHHILQLDDTPESRIALASALRTAGCAVDTSGTDWLKAGRFHKVQAQTAAKAPSPSSTTGVRFENDPSHPLLVNGLLEEVRALHKVYRELDQRDRERVLHPLSSASWPEFGKTWDFVHVRLFCTNERFQRLCHELRRASPTLGLPLDLELYQVDQTTLMVNLLHALDEAAQRLRDLK